MKIENCATGQVVGYYACTGDIITATGRVSGTQLCFAKIIGVGKEFVTVVDEWGRKKRIAPAKLHLAPEGKEYL